MAAARRGGDRARPSFLGPHGVGLQSVPGPDSAPHAGNRPPKPFNRGTKSSLPRMRVVVDVKASVLPVLGLLLVASLAGCLGAYEPRTPGGAAALSALAPHQTQDLLVPAQGNNRLFLRADGADQWMDTRPDGPGQTLAGTVTATGTSTVRASGSAASTPRSMAWAASSAKPVRSPR